MADRESILEWMGRKKYRVVDERSPARRIVERLVLEGKAEWLGAANRVRVRGTGLTDRAREALGEKP